MTKRNGSQLSPRIMRIIRDAWNVISQLNDQGKRVLVILLMDDLKHYEKMLLDPRAKRLMYQFKYDQEHPLKNRKREP